MVEYSIYGTLSGAWCMGLGRTEEMGNRVWVGQVDLAQVVASSLAASPLTLPLNCTFTQSQNPLARTAKWAYVSLLTALNGISQLSALQTIFQLCIPKKDLARPHFQYQLPKYFENRIIMFCLEL